MFIACTNEMNIFSKEKIWVQIMAMQSKKKTLTEIGKKHQINAFFLLFYSIPLFLCVRVCVGGGGKSPKFHVISAKIERFTP